MLYRPIENSTLLTNMNNDKRHLIETAIDLYKGPNKVFIENSAFDILNRLIPDHFAVHTLTKGNDHSDFWKLYEQIDEQYRLKKQYEVQDFPSGKTFYYINPSGKVVELTIHSGISPKAALTLGKAFVLFDTWSEANDVLTELKDTFTFYKG